jgi:hypothetical protein
MFGAPGQFAELLNKQRNAKHRKAETRYDLQKKKETFLKDHPAHVITALEFPEVSEQELENIKKEIRKKAKTEAFFKIGGYAVGTLFFFVLFWLWLYS